MNKISIRGVCLLDNCDTGPQYALNESRGPFKYEASCKFKSRRIGLIEWCTYSGICDLIDIDYKNHIEDASKYTRFWRKCNG